MASMQWAIRKTFIEVVEPQPVIARIRSSSDFSVEYLSVFVEPEACKMDDVNDKASDKSTAVGSWADESDEEREMVIASVDETVTSSVSPCYWPALMPIMPCVMPTTNFTPPASPSRPAEAPILPKPVKEQQAKTGEVRTTVMIRNMPNNYTRKMILELLDLHGFAGQYDFVYLPIDFETTACLGYAFINMVNAAVACRFWSVFNGFTSWAIPSRKVAGVSWSGPHQGLQAHIERYRNSSIMSDSTPDDYKPIIISNGVRVPFPAPTRKLRASRQSGRR
jgi:hypothetical protein